MGGGNGLRLGREVEGRPSDKLHPVELIHQPARQTTQTRFAVILLHGFGSNEEDLIGLAPMLPPTLEIFSLRAPFTLGPGSYAWYHLDWSSGRPNADRQEIADTEAALHARLDALLQDQGLTRAETILLGFSQGSIMSLSEAYCHAQPFKGVVALSGRLPLSLPAQFHANAKATPAFVGHGTDDPVLFHEDGVAISKTLTELGVEVEFHSYPMAHQVSEPELRDLRWWLDSRLGLASRQPAS